jgi:sulfonate transport system substrate-binding protein
MFEHTRSRSSQPARISRLVASVAALVLVTACGGAAASDGPSEITVDWAYYNPVSLVLKDKGWIEEALADRNISVTWVQSAGSNKALEFLNSGSVEFGSTAGAAALLAKVSGSPIKSVYSYSQPEWTALVTNESSDIDSVEDLAGRRVAVTRGTDPYIFLLRALADHGLTEGDIEVVLLQHADGRNALIAEQVDAWAGLDPMMAQSELEQGTRLFYRAPHLNTYGILNVPIDFAEAHPDIVDIVIEAYERGRQWSIENPEELAAILAEAAGLSPEVAAAQLARTDFTGPELGDDEWNSILGAGIALQESGIIDADVDVEAVLTDLFDTSFSEGLEG